LGGKPAFVQLPSPSWSKWVDLLWSGPEIPKGNAGSGQKLKSSKINYELCWNAIYHKMTLKLQKNKKCTIKTEK
jgi:hypothetical protein